MDVNEILTVAQTVAIISALLVTLYFALRQTKAFELDMEARVLTDLNEQMHRIGGIFIEHPELLSVISDGKRPKGPELPFTYYILFFCAHVYHMRERGLLQDNEWNGWRQWMRNAFHAGTLGTTWRDSNMESWIDPGFREFVKRELLAPD